MVRRERGTGSREQENPAPSLIPLSHWSSTEKIASGNGNCIRTGAWQVDHPIGTTWGYTSDMRISGPAAIIAALVDTVSKNGVLR